MSVASIIADFQSTAVFATDGEVALFQKLSDAIVKHSRAQFIDETHGSVAQVEFISRISGKKSRCEISDLLIVSRDSEQSQYRATFWQAKKEPSPKWPGPRGRQNFDFKGQFDQWELLAERPYISGVGSFSPPPGLLANAASPSIGSFGVFFDENGLPEVNYSVAEMVSSVSISKSPRMVINERLSSYTAWANETIAASNLGDFLTRLFSFQVGSIVSLTAAEGIWLGKYVNKKCLNDGKEPFFDISDGENLVDNEGRSDDGVSLLLVEAAQDT